ncbi:hypothetical protein COY48_00050 [Candidatus Collierbacteria bacterium CG_4_10_14_0_8_um_filter_43_86]|uniref:Uncharacterized protein n=1 Tax=Candidatus Collierbacteria bacterium CG22_combo_CG10-13_8_21_14_all_43_12 TaxID=1974537 RepID=A0A2H0DTQ1_9BACT|nr:MAG: hypothetical protein COW83_05365 [Candidatus Collierbacteria bacterium CG22_combo_CG10-13_8_21_14_all_43_12]PIZ24959.1 MAG: hypothetical protein COY48_00050 [Candidatus Collierbacteria bacterium CG_4_10_14_0_8_um_filter_43_86]
MRMEDLDQALFVPKNSYGHYEVAVRIIRPGRGRSDCRIYLEPLPGKYSYSVEDFQMLMNLNEEQPFPILVGKVRIRRGSAPKHELDFERDGRELSFEETIEFMTTMTRWKRIV